MSVAAVMRNRHTRNARPVQWRCMCLSFAEGASTIMRRDHTRAQRYFGGDMLALYISMLTRYYYTNTIRINSAVY
jgi:hypothetical protein